MTDIDRERLDDEDRLPWLEAVDDEEDDRVPAGKLIGLVVAALVALGLVVGGVWALKHRAPGPNGDGRLIAAQEGDYKVRPDAPGGMRVEGQGDSAFATSEGHEADGKIDLGATPETPVAGTRPAAKPGAPIAGKPVVTAAVPASGGKLVAPPPPRPQPGTRGAAQGGSMIQLGAFGSEAKANEAWVSMTKRFAYLAPMAKSVVAAQVGGATVYRLRASGADATTTCGKLRVAGEGCIVVE